MVDNIKSLFEETLNGDLLSIIISNSSDKEKILKIKIRPVLLKEKLYFQISEFIGNQIFHSNVTKNTLVEKLPDWFQGLFRQAEIKTRNGQAVILISNKGKVTIKNKILRKMEIKDIINNNNYVQEDTGVLLHNKKKNYILQEGIVLPFLTDLGVMTKEGFIVKSKSDKFRQINRFLEYINDILPFLDKSKELTILDFGCGKSYLTFAMYYYLKIQKNYNINIIGLDLKQDVIKHCNSLRDKYGYDKLHFLQGDIASYNGIRSVDMVVTLHACDTATDYALFKAVSWGAEVILSVPCCQHELNGQIQNELLQPILKNGIIKERIAALITDALRAELLETKGYRVQLLEFIDMEHTPKNILIRAVKHSTIDSVNKRKNIKLKECMEFLGVSPCLKHLFDEMKKEGE